jgi:crotonobetainyl-CoA:carnitine CoA-transferase CaiB-like acyl-CoA transferase
MALTGFPAGSPRWPRGDVVRSLEDACLLLGELSHAAGTRVDARPADLLCQRAAWRGLTAGGQVSAGGQCRLLRADDGWVAVTLARPSDFDAVPALVGGGSAAAVSRSADVAWDALSGWAAHSPASDVAARAQLLEIPAAPVPARRASPRRPWVTRHLGETGPRPNRRPVVVDLSAMWAGPLCAHLLGLAGAEVVKVEDPDRPDAARLGDPELFHHLHEGHRIEQVSFLAPDGPKRLRDLLEEADIVIEGSRPRAMAALGIHPASFLRQRPGRTWVSITGYGRTGPRSNYVAFGDDAAAGGGLVAEGPTGPVFCADAVADPITGLYAAVAALGSLTSGGGDLLDCAMTRAVAHANAMPGCPRMHRCVPDEDGWVVSHTDDRDRVPVERPIGHSDVIAPPPW